ncbi:uncharacterized protein LOC115209391 isoform X2 [Argonauta hians]
MNPYFTSSNSTNQWTDEQNQSFPTRNYLQPPQDYKPNQLDNNAFSYEHIMQNKRIERIQNEILSDIIAVREDGRFPDAWAAITYMEADRQVKQIYATERSYVIDNSDNMEDQFRIGLRSLESCQANILFEKFLNLILYQNEDGNISLMNKSNFPVFIKDYIEGEHPCFSREVLSRQGVLTTEGQPFDIFDIEEFRCEMSLQILNRQFNENQLLHYSQIKILFSDAQYCLESPSWIIVTNIRALDLIYDEEEYSALKARMAFNIAGDAIKTMKTMKKKSLKHNTFETKRKTRMSLMMKNYRVKDFMKYSWETEDDDATNNENDEIVMPEADYESEPKNPRYIKLTGNKMWAKVQYTLATF